MLEHHIQKDILKQLVHAPEARFADLKPDSVEGNVFTYHLQQLIKAGLVEKTDDGRYHLTAAGKQEGIASELTKSEARRQAHAIFLVHVRDTEGRWLLRKRMVHPSYGKVGFIHGEPKAGEPVIETASKRLQQKAGLHAELRIAGSGYITINHGDELESYVAFTLLTGIVSARELIESDSTGENFWATDPDFSSDEFVPSMHDLVAQPASEQPFFAELTYNL